MQNFFSLSSSLLFAKTASVVINSHVTALLPFRSTHVSRQREINASPIHMTLHPLHHNKTVKFQLHYHPLNSFVVFVLFFRGWVWVYVTLSLGAAQRDTAFIDLFLFLPFRLITFFSTSSHQSDVIRTVSLNYVYNAKLSWWKKNQNKKRSWVLSELK